MEVPLTAGVVGGGCGHHRSSGAGRLGGLRSGEAPHPALREQVPPLRRGRRARPPRRGRTSLKRCGHRGLCRSLPVLRISLALTRSLLLLPRRRRRWRDIAISHAQRATLRVARPTRRGSGSSGSRPFLPPLLPDFAGRFAGAIVRSPPQALRQSVVSVSQERQPAHTPLHRSARTRGAQQRAQRGVLRRGFAYAILCARKGDCDEFGERAAMAHRSREGKAVRRTSAGRQGAGELRRWTSGPGSRGRASHAGIDYGLTMSCGEEARPWVGQPGK
jgi:hypothetical protein